MQENMDRRGVSHPDAAEAADQDNQARLDRWFDKARAIEALSPTGDLVADATAYLHATGLDSKSLNATDRIAFDLGDREGILRYFKELDVAVGNSPGGHQGLEAVDQAKRKFIAEFLRANGAR